MFLFFKKKTESQPQRQWEIDASFADINSRKLVSVNFHNKCEFCESDYVACFSMEERSLCYIQDTHEFFRWDKVKSTCPKCTEMINAPTEYLT